MASANEREQIAAKIKDRLKNLGLALTTGIGGSVITVIIILIYIKLSKS